MSDSLINWEVFKGDKQPNPKRIQQLPPPPPWRQFRKPQDPSQELTPGQQQYLEKIARYWQEVQARVEAGENNRDRQRGESFCVRADQSRVIQSVNAALALRRPLLITGRPGSGKTSLAYAIAYELQLGPVLMWPITARTTLEAGLYRYDAIARLQDAQLGRQQLKPEQEHTSSQTIPERRIGDYIQLGPLGTAFLPAPYPRVLLIDEVDKSDINLPNDLLNLLEEGQFEIPELVRLNESGKNQESAMTSQNSSKTIQIRTADDIKVGIEGGKIRCDAFPLIIMTSNGERDFPPAFLRRCLRVEMPKPIETDLYDIVKAHLTEEVANEVDDLISRFFQKTNSEAALLATDQLLNAVYLRKYGAQLEADGTLEDLLLKALTSTGGGG
jgi:MoxR-like ATPase